jgi:hypothetical protein
MTSLTMRRPWTSANAPSLHGGSPTGGVGGCLCRQWGRSGASSTAGFGGRHHRCRNVARACARRPTRRLDRQHVERERHSHLVKTLRNNET